VILGQYLKVMQNFFLSRGANFLDFGGKFISIAEKIIRKEICLKKEGTISVTCFCEKQRHHLLRPKENKWCRKNLGNV